MSETTIPVLRREDAGDDAAREERPRPVWWRRVADALKPAGWPLAAGALAACGFPPLHLIPVLPVAFFLLMRSVSQARTMKQAALAGFAFGLSLHAVGLYWLINAVLIRASDFWWFVPFPSLGCALILAPFAAVPAALCRLAPAGWRRGTLFAGLWTLCDMARLFLFSGFTWNPLGSDWAFHGLPGDILIQPAAWIGVDGLTLLTVLLAVLLPLGRRFAMLCGMVLLVWITAGAIRFHEVVRNEITTRDQPVVVLVQGNVAEKDKISRSDIQDVFDRYLRLTQQGVATGLALAAKAPGAAPPVVYVWPETAYPGILEEDGLSRTVIARTAAGASEGMIGSLGTGPDGHWRNSVVAIDGAGRFLGRYDKARLVPFGEYQPPFLPLQVVPGGGMTPGPGPVSWHLPGLSTAGPLVCYEVIFSGHVVDRKDRPDWLVNVTNDAWYGNSAGPRQHLAAVRLRAVEEGLPVARAANTGVTIVYDARGHDMGRLGWGTEGTLVRIMPRPLPPTLFARFGQAIPAGLCLISIVVALTRRRQFS
ncbi:apolipoprotein N-acyltransferase [Acetobacter musti]|uniref:Apolipoprotein N-acyltransferase n=1 Tax=Acetobacter musti TaxID=864732 RepID=A0ABX0JIM3_9PROT|nr:apolipoprotein N-acyltransferase [Acetobacter musti]NHN83468.1 apolipoprotein N-acyltransferase [Acetobacter musti]